MSENKIKKESEGGKWYSIDEVARKVKLSQKRIRDYEKEGFIKPKRNKRTNNRLFSEFEIGQIQRINYLIHKKGFTINSLKQLFKYAPCWEIFQCKENSTCIAYQKPHEPCWKLTKECNCDKPCESCVVYLMRSVKKEKLLARQEDLR